MNRNWGPLSQLDTSMTKNNNIRPIFLCCRCIIIQKTMISNPPFVVIKSATEWRRRLYIFPRVTIINISLFPSPYRSVWVPFRYKDRSFRYTNSHYKDQTFFSTFVFIIIIPVLARRCLYIETLHLILYASNVYISITYTSQPWRTIYDCWIIFPSSNNYQICTSGCNQYEQCKWY